MRSSLSKYGVILISEPIVKSDMTKSMSNDTEGHSMHIQTQSYYLELWANLGFRIIES